MKKCICITLFLPFVMTTLSFSCDSTEQSQNMEVYLDPSHMPLPFHEPDPVSFVVMHESVTSAYWTDKRMRSATSFVSISGGELGGVRPTDREFIHKELKANDLLPFYTSDDPIKADVENFPFSTGGRLAYIDSNGVDSYCSAQFVGSSRVIMTAAHCMQDRVTGMFYRNFNFRRAYNNGGGQSVGLICGAVYSDWKTGSEDKDNWKRDYGFFYTSSESEGGWLGLKKNENYSNWTAIGYPVAYGTSQYTPKDKEPNLTVNDMFKMHNSAVVRTGRYMIRVDGGLVDKTHGIVTMNNNPMRSGSSGGAWIADLTDYQGSGNYAIGLNSYHMRDKYTYEFGPEFDDLTLSLFEFVSNMKCKNTNWPF
ncbi:MAG: hypothetical protein HRT35_02635 [Algicola sp.]|nr:hypothetical protein [Algicola sp.]